MVKEIYTLLIENDLSDEVEHCMSYDEKTTAEAMIEIHFNLYELKESISSYKILSQDEWTIIAGKEGEYLLKEFDTYGILIYPVNTAKDIIQAFSFRLDKIDKFREILYKPLYWRENITIYINKNIIYTSNDLNLEKFNGLDLVNNILKNKGIEFRDNDGLLTIITEIERPLDKEKLNSAIEKLAKALSLYYKIKEAQEDIAQKLALGF